MNPTTAVPPAEPLVLTMRDRMTPLTRTPQHLEQAQQPTLAEVATRLTEVLGRPIAYRHPGLLQFMRRQHAKGTPLTFAAVMAGIYTTARLGLAARLTDDLRRLLGRTPISFRQYVEDYQTCW